MHEFSYLFAPSFVLIANQECRYSEQHSKEDDADDRGVSGTGEIQEDIRRDELHEDFREGELTQRLLPSLQRLEIRQLASALCEPFGGQTEDDSDEDADERGNHRRSDQHAQNRRAVFSECRQLRHSQHRCDHHDQDQRHDDQTQQIDIRAGDDIGPFESAIDDIGVIDVDDL